MSRPRRTRGSPGPNVALPGWTAVHSTCGRGYALNYVTQARADAPDRLGGQLRVHRQGEDLLRGRLRDREGALAVPEVGVGAAEVQRHGIMDPPVDAVLGERGARLGAVL